MQILKVESQIIRTSDTSYDFLIEEFVHPDYKRDSLTEKCELFWDYIEKRVTFPPGNIPLKHVVYLDKEEQPKETINGPYVDTLDKIPVSFQRIHELSCEMGYTFTGTTSQWMRMLWKYGKVRRFFRGYWANALQGNSTGTKHGVRYLW